MSQLQNCEHTNGVTTHDIQCKFPLLSVEMTFTTILHPSSGTDEAGFSAGNVKQILREKGEAG